MSAAIKLIEDGQTDEIIHNIYSRLKDNSKVKWKDSIKKVIGIELPNQAGLDI